MRKYKVVLFDLDGTLSDPKVGITKSVQYALQKMRKGVPEVDQLECFIGPTLQLSFTEYCHFDEATTIKAIEYYRERFKDVGMFENELYPHIPELLKSLKEQNISLVVATSKPTVFAERILAYFKIDHYFDHIIGSHLDGTRSTKGEIIQYILELYKGYELSDFVMVGDRKHDVIGAKETGISSIGVTYGYGSYEELSDSKPTYIVDGVDQLDEVLLGYSIK
ncbi:HAD-IA family hydrolase [Alkalihalophilus lindianensis]|uniref:HAD-IA family hydrolase n=1 Tax=Alkalihalophilus lindianensis TaxID=1630542 RepID=A0ABU3X4P0_9BACI|nr:HAD-IA family hydrolase [Alkalihalophilus lindianensis]MDV2682846.1 HAD-IA family hydrolase [Alkalihalophilus lindianensis]